MDALAVYLLLAGFALVSGFNDGGNLLAVLVSSRILPVVIVIAEIGVCVFAAPFLVGTQVARTIGGGILPAPDLTLPVVAAALAATLATLIGCYATKVPTSITFALVGSMCGAGTVMLGADHVEWRSLWRVAGSLVVSVVLAGLAGYAAHTAAKLAFRGASARAGRAALWSEAVTSALVCIGYGANDAEKTIGLLSLVYGIAHHAARFVVTGWMIAFSTIAFAGALRGRLAGGADGPRPRVSHSPASRRAERVRDGRGRDRRVVPGWAGEHHAGARQLARRRRRQRALPAHSLAGGAENGLGVDA